MEYIESTSLFNLHTVNCDAVFKHINSIQNLEIVTSDKIIELLKIVQDESMIVHKNDFPIRVTFEVNDGRFYISFEQEYSLFLHLKLVPRMITIALYIRDLFIDGKSAIDLFCMFMVDYLDAVASNNYYRAYCTLNSGKLLQALNKIDKIFDFKGVMFKYIYDYGLYGEAFKDPYDEFEVTFSVAELIFDSKAKMNNRSKDSILSIKFKEDIKYNEYFITCNIFVYNQSLIIPFDEFIQSDFCTLRNLIFSMLRINNVDVSSIAELKDFLIIEEMKNI